jgi:hypothetical protein
MRESLEISPILATPIISDASINGTAIIFNDFTKIVPIGFIQLTVKSADQPISILTKP